MTVSGDFYLEYMGFERVPVAGGDVLAIRLDGKQPSVDPDSPMPLISETLVPGHQYHVIFEEIEK